jgi:regulator of cell morphogenesis and NO signaling
MEISPSTLVSDIAYRHPESAGVFERHEIDYCCGGRRPIAEACAERNLSFDALRSEIEAAVRRTAQPDAPLAPQASLAEILDHVLAQHHGRLRDDVPRIARLCTRAAKSHSARYPELVGVAHRLERLCRTLEDHAAKEERVLFPLIRMLDGYPGMGHPPVATLEAPIHAMTTEHDVIASALERLSQDTQGYALPDDACNSLRAVYYELKELERSLYDQMRIEEQILFARTLELEREGPLPLAARRGGARRARVPARGSI